MRGRAVAEMNNVECSIEPSLKYEGGFIKNALSGSFATNYRAITFVGDDGVLGVDRVLDPSGTET